MSVTGCNSLGLHASRNTTWYTVDQILGAVCWKGLPQVCDFCVQLCFPLKVTSAIFRAIASQQCLVEFMSGDWVGKSCTWKGCRPNHCITGPTVWTGALPCCKIVFRRRRRATKDLFIGPLMISSYWCVLTDTSQR